MADEVDSQVSSLKTWRSWFIYLRPLVPILWFGVVHSSRYHLLEACVATATYVFLSTLAAIHLNRLVKEAEDKASRLRDTSSEYLKIAIRSKWTKDFELHTSKPLKELQGLVSTLDLQRQCRDNRFQVSVRLIDRARVTVRDQFVIEMDPEKLFESEEPHLKQSVV
jgi:hypothetical protein